MLILHNETKQCNWSKTNVRIDIKLITPNKLTDVFSINSKLFYSRKHACMNNIQYRIYNIEP